MSDPLHLVRCRIDASRLYGFARRSRAATAREFDEGYAVHALFAALFDHGAAQPDRVAPKPFRVAASRKPNAGVPRWPGRWLEVLGYAAVDHRELARRATSSADPSSTGVCDLGTIASKPLPPSFERGARLGFSVRICPVARIARRGPMERDRAEVDAYVAHRWQIGGDEPADRETVYAGWLRDELRKEDAATLVQGTMTGFQLRHLYRRTQGAERKSHRTDRPDVTFDGVLQVGDPDAFLRRLARGVGRHRAFGFGMLLLRPVASGR
ncbi:MAG TPA: type I-E CRISPR-associated protein Cas6/Cse3/CasE [Polyangiaceae bacterium]